MTSLNELNIDRAYDVASETAIYSVEAYPQQSNTDMQKFYGNVVKAIVKDIQETEHTGKVVTEVPTEIVQGIRERATFELENAQHAQSARNHALRSDWGITSKIASASALILGGTAAYFGMEYIGEPVHEVAEQVAGPLGDLVGLAAEGAITVLAGAAGMIMGVGGAAYASLSAKEVLVNAMNRDAELVPQLRTLEQSITDTPIDPEKVVTVS
jgi:hypothetical protein